MALSKTTQDHDEIRQWAEARGGKPAEVTSTSESGTGILRIEFPGAANANDANLNEISWEEFFEKFDASNLSLVYQEVTAEGAESNFNKLVHPENASGSARKSTRKTAGKKASSTKKTSASKKTAPVRGAANKAAKAPAKKTAAAKKTPAKKAAGNAPAKKTAARKAAPAKKTAAKKAVAKKTVARKTVAKKTAVKKTAVKKPAAKKAAGKKSAAKRTTAPARKKSVATKKSSRR